MIVHQEDCGGYESKQAQDEGICRSMCFGHMECEPDRKDDFSFCGECLHIFRTAQDLLDAHNKILKNLGDDHIETDVDNINTCPVCLHDL